MPTNPVTSSFLADAPYFLDVDAVTWVEDTLAAMSVEERVGQLMCLYLRDSASETWLEELAGRGIRPGGILVLSRTRPDVGADIERLQRFSTTPMLVAANLEAGLMLGGRTLEAFANPMQLAATGDSETARRLAIHCARSANATGVNWAFAPVIDIAVNPANPITNTRTFGADPDTVASFATAYIRELESRGVATSPKHFPGDGVDDRDQHLVTTSNDLDSAAWWTTYGMVYRHAIEAGAKTIMAGHIRQPALTREVDPSVEARAMMPATLSPELLGGVLRDRLGFDGLIVSDNSAMTGMTAMAPRRIALPRMLDSGIDMILGNLDVDEDFRILLEAVADGRISRMRLDDAVRRVLGVKASIGLHTGTDRRGYEQPEPEEEADWRRDIAQRSATLVKDTQGLLPLRPRTHRRALVYALESAPTFYDPTPSLLPLFVERLRGRGLEVEVRTVPGNTTTPAEAERLHERFDVCVYFTDLRFVGNANHSRIAWSPWQGHDAPRHVASLPTALVSIADPYVLQDMPMIRTAINCYTPTTASVEAAVELLFGDRPAVGVSPIDPFVGHWDARL